MCTICVVRNVSNETPSCCDHYPLHITKYYTREFYFVNYRVVYKNPMFKSLMTARRPHNQRFPGQNLTGRWWGGGEISKLSRPQCPGDFDTKSRPIAKIEIKMFYYFSLVSARRTDYRIKHPCKQNAFLSPRP